MPPKPQSIYDIYFQITDENTAKFGSKTILFYQVGAFFEMYGIQTQKGVIKSKVEEFTQLAQLNMSAKEIDTPLGAVIMAGFRDYSLDKYLKIATQNGYTAVVYVQNATNPKAITRELHGVFSPGTYLSFDTDSSPTNSNNIVCIWLQTYLPLKGCTPNLVCSIASAHIFTGETSIFEYETPFFMNPTTFDELERCIATIAPSEAIIISFLSDKETAQVLPYFGLKTQTIHRVSLADTSPQKKHVDNCQKQTFVQHILATYFGEEAYSICREFQVYPTATQSFCYLIHFIQEHNPNLLVKIALPHCYNSTNRMTLANHTLKQLNIIEDDSEDGKQSGRFSSVSAFLNRCKSAMGRRTFQKQIANPTTNIEWLETEYNRIFSFMTTTQDDCLDDIRRKLGTIRDLEKICRQIVCQKIYPNSIFHLIKSVEVASELMEEYENFSGTSPAKITHDFLKYVHSVLDVEKCRGIESITIQENIFRPGIFENLDIVAKEYIESITLFDNIRKTLNRIMQQSTIDETEYIKVHETEKSGASLQLTKKRAEMMRNALKDPIEFRPHFTVCPKDIRFIKASSSMEEIEFPQLTTLLKRIGLAKVRMVEEISKGFSVFLRTIETEWYESIQQIIQWIIQLDILQSKTYVAKKYKYCRPTIEPTDKSFFQANGVRHVLIEHIQQNEIYVTNDLALSSETSEYDGILLYGTNAVGKTSFIRAIGICIIMAQAGMFVPCASFVYSPYQAIFSRILGNDNLFKGLSTFAVEMSELRVILKYADQKSLVLGDELCSGTETESALSLFSAGLVALYNRGATFLFATHFHEITNYDEIQALTRLGIKHMSVTYDPSSQILLYDRLLKPGQGTRMYGLEVCRSLYMDPDFMEQAYAFRTKYFSDTKGELGFSRSTYNAKKIRGVCEMCHKEISDEVHHLSPQKDADSAGFIDGFHKNHPGNLLAVCESCHLSIHSKGTKITKKKTTKGYVLKTT